MQILQTFGLNPYLTIAQIINFLILLYILKRYLYPPLFKIFKKREELVTESIKKADDAESALEKAKESEKEIIKNARHVADDILKDARDQADEIVKEAEVHAKEKSDKMILDAKAVIELESSQAKKELSTYVLKLSLDILKKSLPSVFSEKEQNEIINKAVKEMQKIPN